MFLAYDVGVYLIEDGIYRPFGRLVVPKMMQQRLKKVNGIGPEGVIIHQDLSEVKIPRLIYLDFLACARVRHVPCPEQLLGQASRWHADPV